MDPGRVGASTSTGRNRPRRDAITMKEKGKAVSTTAAHCNGVTA